MWKALTQFDHWRFRRRLSAYLDGALAEGVRRRLEAHLASCEACRQELAELRATVQALGSLPLVEVPRSFALQAAPGEEMPPRPTVRRLELALPQVKAVLAFALARAVVGLTLVVTFALAVVVISDFAGLPEGREKGGMLAAVSPEAEERAVPMQAPAVTTAVPLATPSPPPATGYGYWELATPEAAGIMPAPEEAPQEAAKAEAAVEEEGGPSWEEVMRWLEVGLGAGLGALVLVWAFARFRRGRANQR